MTETYDFGSGLVPAHRHRNGDRTLGGWVADTAHVAPTAHVSQFGLVYDTARVLESSRVYDGARIAGNSLLAGVSRAWGDALLAGSVPDEAGEEGGTTPGRGKTLALLCRARDLDLAGRVAYIVVTTRQRAHHVALLAQSHGLPYRHPVTVGEVLKMPSHAPDGKPFVYLVDDVDDHLRAMLGYRPIDSWRIKDALLGGSVPAEAGEEETDD